MPKVRQKKLNSCGMIITSEQLAEVEAEAEAEAEDDDDWDEEDDDGVEFIYER